MVRERWPEADAAAAARRGSGAAPAALLRAAARASSKHGRLVLRSATLPCMQRRREGQRRLMRAR
jgi:hypothetical protein